MKHEGARKQFVVEHERHGKTSRFETSSLATRVGMPCESCNNGWMSELENAVKPFMAQMVFPGDMTFLSEERRRLLSRWAVKVAMVNEFFKPDGRFYFSDSERKEFMSSTHVRNDIYVWLARTTPHCRCTRCRSARSTTPQAQFTSTASR